MNFAKENLKSEVEKVVQEEVIVPEKTDKKYIRTQIQSIILSLLLLLLLSIFTKFSKISSLENSLFYLTYNLPSIIGSFLSGIMQFGAIVFVVTAAAIAFIYNKIKLARDLFLSGFGAWFLAKLIKILVNRPRPFVLLPDVALRAGHESGLGFPSGHDAVAAALGFILWPYLGKFGKFIVLVVILLVGMGRIYVGAHYPLDIVGGALIGWFIASLIYIIFKFKKAVNKEVFEEAYFEFFEKFKFKKSTFKKYFYILLSIAATVIFIPLLNEVPEVADSIRKMDILWLLPILFFSVLTYVFAAIAQIGAVSSKLPFFETFLVQLGSSFTNRIVPAGLGGVGLNTRFLEKRGQTLTEAGTSVAVKSLFGTLMTSFFTVIGLTVIGESIADNFEIPFWIVPLLILVILLISLLITLKPNLQTFIKSKINESLNQIKQISNSKKIMQLILGNLGLTFSYALAFYFSMKAFNINIDFFKAFVIYTVGSTIGSAFPTPGGLGGVEASLAGGLAAFNVEAETAVAAVLIYRLATFWLPTFAGIIAFKILQKRNAI